MKKTLPLFCSLLLLVVSPISGQEGMASAPELDPSVPRGLRVNTPEAFDGYTMLSPLNSMMTYLVDMEGEVVHVWKTDAAPGSEYLMDDGTLLRCAREDDNPQFNGGGIGGRLQRIAPDGTVLWQWRLADEHRHQHHDIEPMPNGNVLMIFWERVPKSGAIEWGRDPAQVGTRGLWPDGLLEVKPLPPDNAEIVWEWHSWDHMVQDQNSDFANFDDIPLRPERIDVNADHRDTAPLTAEQREEEEEMLEQLEAMGYVGGEELDEEEDSDPVNRSGDLMHTNGISYLPEFDLIVMSSPEFNELWVIDHSTTSIEAASYEGGRWKRGGDLLWRWGNPRNYGAGVDSDRKLFYQHNPTWIVDGNELRVLVFNNGGQRGDGNYSSIEELVLPFDPERGFLRDGRAAYGPKEPSWSYSDRESFYSAFISGAQRLPNGNTLICSGVAGRIFEVTRAGKIVWDYYNPFGGDITPPAHAGNAPPLALFRATRLAADHPGIEALLRR